MTESRVGTRCNKTPGRTSCLLLQANLGAPREHVGDAGPQSQLVYASVLTLPFHRAFANTEFSVFRNVEDLWKTAVRSVAFGLEFHAVRKPVHSLSEFHLL